MKPLNYVGVVLLGFGGVLSLWTMREQLRRRALLRDPVKVQGIIIRVRHVRPTDTDSVGTSRPGQYFATVRYQTKDRQTIERELPATSDSSECRRGAAVQLVYQRGNPRNVVYGDMRWGDLRKSTIGSLVFFVIGALLCFCVDAK